MQRQHFDAIIREIDAMRSGETYEIRLDLRNGKYFVGKLSHLTDAPEVITLTHHQVVTFIALTAIAAVGVFQP